MKDADSQCDKPAIDRLHFSILFNEYMLSSHFNWTRDDLVLPILAAEIQTSPSFTPIVCKK